MKCVKINKEREIEREREKKTTSNYDEKECVNKLYNI